MDLERLFDGVRAQADHVSDKYKVDDRMRDVFARSVSVLGRISDVLVRNGREPKQYGLSYGDAREFSARLLGLAVELAILNGVTPKDVTNYLSDHGYTFPAASKPEGGA